MAHLLACLHYQSVGRFKFLRELGADLAIVENGDYNLQEDLRALLDAVVVLLRLDPDLFSNRVVGDLIPNVADFISVNATLNEGTGSATLLRRDIMTSISQLLSAIGGLPDLPTLLQEQASRIAALP